MAPRAAELVRDGPPARGDCVEWGVGRVRRELQAQEHVGLGEEVEPALPGELTSTAEQSAAAEVDGGVGLADRRVVDRTGLLLSVGDPEGRDPQGEGVAGLAGSPVEGHSRRAGARASLGCCTQADHVELGAEDRGVVGEGADLRLEEGVERARVDHEPESRFVGRRCQARLGRVGEEIGFVVLHEVRDSGRVDRADPAGDVDGVCRAPVGRHPDVAGGEVGAGEGPAAAERDSLSGEIRLGMYEVRHGRARVARGIGCEGDDPEVEPEAVGEAGTGDDGRSHSGEDRGRRERRQKEVNGRGGALDSATADQCGAGWEKAAEVAPGPRLEKVEVALVLESEESVGDPIGEVSHVSVGLVQGSHVVLGIGRRASSMLA